MGAEPLAYRDVTLKSHHVRVAALISLLFERMLKARTPVALELDRYTGLEATLYHAAVLSGLLHDIGKASRNYRREGPYPYHELLSGIILYRGARAAAKIGWDGLSCILSLVAWSVSRHHVAMSGRHPKDRVTTGERLRILTKALAMTDSGDLRRSIPKLLEAEGVREILNLLTSQLSSIPDAGRAARDGLKGISDYDDRMKGSPLVCGFNKSYWITAVELITGPLIVSDILAARFEGRDTDEGAMPAYARSWLLELKVENTIKRLDTDEAERRLTSIVGSIASLMG